MSTHNVIIYKISKIIYKYRRLFFEAKSEIYITRAAFRKDYRKIARARIARAITVVLYRQIVKRLFPALFRSHKRA